MDFGSLLVLALNAIDSILIIILVALGLLVIKGTGGIIVAVVGLVPLVAGLFDFCVFAPLFGAPMSGPKIRAGK